MAWNQADELVVASNGAVYFAPVGTALPLKGDDPTAALGSAFAGAGFITEDGASLSVGSEVTDFMAWQSRQAVRREKTSQEIQFTFAFQQWNEENIVFAFGGGVVAEEGGGLYSYTFPEDDDALDERSLVVDWQDGDKNYRCVFARGNATDAVETKFARSESAQLPITFKVLAPEEGGAPGYILTDDPAFTVGS